MSKAQRKRLMQIRNKFDEKQAIFNTAGVANTKPKQAEVVITSVDILQRVMCPFCLVEGKLQQFLVSTKKGISQYRAKCPECSNGMLMRTLMADMTPETYADFCFGYVSDGFWSKVPFERWKSRLATIGWARQFWDRYKALKGDSGIENYEDYIMRTQNEAHQHDEEEYG